MMRQHSMATFPEKLCKFQAARRRSWTHVDARRRPATRHAPRPSPPLPRAAGDALSDDSIADMLCWNETGNGFIARAPSDDQGHRFAKIV